MAKKRISYFKIEAEAQQIADTLNEHPLGGCGVRFGVEYAFGGWVIYMEDC